MKMLDSNSARYSVQDSIHFLIESLIVVSVWGSGEKPIWALIQISVGDLVRTSVLTPVRDSIKEKIYENA